jgi:hypothetical protein
VPLLRLIKWLDHQATFAANDWYREICIEIRRRLLLVPSIDDHKSIDRLHAHLQGNGVKIGRGTLVDVLKELQ